MFRDKDNVSVNINNGFSSQGVPGAKEYFTTSHLSFSRRIQLDNVSKEEVTYTKIIILLLIQLFLFKYLYFFINKNWYIINKKSTNNWAIAFIVQSDE